MRVCLDPMQPSQYPSCISTCPYSSWIPSVGSTPHCSGPRKPTHCTASMQWYHWWPISWELPTLASHRWPILPPQRVHCNLLPPEGPHLLHQCSIERSVRQLAPTQRLSMKRCRENKIFVRHVLSRQRIHRMVLPMRASTHLLQWEPNPGPY